MVESVLSMCEDLGSIPNNRGGGEMEEDSAAWEQPKPALLSV